MPSSTDFHTSPSDLNLFLEEPALWFVKQFLGYRTISGASAHRGTAIEFGLASHLLGALAKPVDEAHNVPIGEDAPSEPKQRALYRYRQLTFGEITDDIEDEFKNVGLMFDQAVLSFKNRATEGEKPLIQWGKRINTTIEGLAVQGILDFVYPDCLVDLKTTKAIPSKPRAGHVRQVAIYSHATGLPALLCYVSAKKSLWHQINEEQSAKALSQVKAACRAIRRIRSQRDWREAAEFYPPRDLESFYYDQISTHIVSDIWQL